MINLRKKLRKNSRAGVSLIIAIIFVSAFILVIAGLAEAQMRTIQNIGNRRNAIKVRNLAYAAEALAAYWISTHGVGANSGDSDLSDLSILNETLFDTASAIGLENCDDMDANPANGLQPCMGFEVSGRAAAADTIEFDGADYFSAPSKGTGNAGSCPTDSADADQACNWNRLAVGETVEIPLYYELDTDGDGDLDIVKPDFTADDFKLRVRAPCENFNSPEFTGNCGWPGVDRITLYPPAESPAVSPAYRSVENVGDNPSDPVLVQWTISDLGGAGTSTLLARDSTVTAREGGILAKRRVVATGGGFSVSYTEQNTEISAGRINLAKNGLSLGDPLENFTVLQYIPSGVDRDKNRGIDLNRNDREIGPYISTFSNPVLRLTAVGQPQRNDPLPPQDINDRNLDIPFLEYQVLTKDIEIADSKSFIRAWAQVGDFRKEFRKTLQREATLGGFVVEQF